LITLTVAEMARIVGGEIHGDPSQEVTGTAVIDSREAKPGDLFVAFAGENVDGHDFAESAVANGAVAVLGSRPVAAASTIVVADVQKALQRLAQEVLSGLRPNIKVIALTGSVGKTSVKDMLASVLAETAETIATRGSFNNEIGLPLTVLRADSSTRFLVLEMGARGLGHLAELTAIAPPDISLVLNVGTAHIGEFGGRENIALAKGEIVDALGPTGIAVLNLDDPAVAGMAERAAGEVITFGTRPDADITLGAVELDSVGRPSFTLTRGGESLPISMQLVGAHQAMNAAAVAATSLACDIPLAVSATSLSAVSRLSQWRMEVTDCADGLMIINDAYNANPESMAAALATLAEIGRQSERRTIAVLGEMRELGETSASSHHQLGLQTERIDMVLAVGAGSREIVTGRGELEGPKRPALYFESLSDAGDWLVHNVASDDVVLVKASRSIGLEELAAMLVREHDIQEGGGPV
jgi:UDP-N-acetylmuramoyl-tripeptide--D-alanyl-D-alanine ligase